MEDIRAFLAENAEKMGICLTDEQTEKFQAYAELLVEWNEKMNLTAIKEPREIAVKHFVDSLTIFSCIQPKKEAKVIDIGSGAGFPGIPMKLYREDLKLTLLDSLNKRLTFLGEVSDRLHLDTKRIHARAEEAGRDLNLRMKFDIATARAVAPLNVLCEYCLPFVRLGGIFAAMKGPNAEEELEGAKNAIQVLGCELEEVKTFTLPDDSKNIQKYFFTPLIFLHKTHYFRDNLNTHINCNNLEINFVFTLEVVRFVDFITRKEKSS